MSLTWVLQVILQWKIRCSKMHELRLYLNSTLAKTRIILWLSRSRGFLIHYAYWSCSYGCSPVARCSEYGLSPATDSWAFSRLVNHEAWSHDHSPKQNRYYLQRRRQNKVKLQANQGVHERHEVQKRSDYSNFGRTRI